MGRVRATSLPLFLRFSSLTMLMRSRGSSVAPGWLIRRLLIRCRFAVLFVASTSNHAGRGGQKVNKTSNCVQLVHGPTGLIVKCQKTRSRARNRTLARQWLAAKLDDHHNYKHGTSKAAMVRLFCLRR